MNLKPLLRRLSALEQQRNPPNYMFVWRDWFGRYSIDGERVDEAVFQRWREQQPEDAVIYVLAHGTGVEKDTDHQHENKESE